MSKRLFKARAQQWTEQQEQQQQQQNEEDEEDEVVSNDTNNSPSTPVFNIEDLVTIESMGIRRVDRLRTDGTDYKIKVKLPDDIPDDIIEFVRQVFQFIVGKLLDNVPDTDKVALQVDWDHLDRPAFLPFALRRDFSVDLLLAKIQNIMQSNTEANLATPFTVSVMRVEMPVGNGPKQRKLRGVHNRFLPKLTDWLIAKRSVIQIQNTDKLCLGRALAVAIARCHYTKGLITLNQFRNRKQSYSMWQKSTALQLYAKAGVTPGGGGVEELAQFQESLLMDYQIVARSLESFGGIIFDGSPAPQQLNLFYHDNHFDVITDVPAFLGKSHYCADCKEGYDQINECDFGESLKHKCKKKKCACCLRVKCETGEWRFCQDCGRWMQSEQCYDNHLKRYRNCRTVCEKIRKCNSCGLITGSKAGKVHVCGQRFCILCKTNRPLEHLCFIPTVKSKHISQQAGTMEEIEEGEEEEEVEDKEADEDSGKCKVLLDDVYNFVFYDFETSQNTSIEGLENHFTHVVNLAVAHSVCHSCSVNLELRADCSECSQHVFKGIASLDEFTDWLLKQNGATAIAHYGSGFDAILLTKALISRGIALHKPVYRGRKIMTAQIQIGHHGIRLLDSLNFVQSPLSAFPKLFNLHELTKGYFPHLFNTQQNESYVGPFPSAKYYDPDSMSIDRRKTFFEWYEEERAKTFDMAKEIELYCQSDVQILKEGMLSLRKMFIELANVDALRECTTIASTAMRCFRQNYLQEDSIGIIPRYGYTNYRKQSRSGLLWLKWWSASNGVRVAHNGNGPETRVGPYFVDGFIKESNTVLEFLGCFYHSCPSCFDLSSVNPLTKIVRKNENAATMERLQYIRNQGYHVVYTWECEWNTKIKNDVSVSTNLSSLTVTDPLKPCDALFGGRTNAIRLYATNLEPHSEIKVLDFTSLYPFVNSRCPYPLGHPTIITEEFGPLRDYFGLIKCRVLPPDDLFLPVLPRRSRDGKLTFPLCVACADSVEQSECCHDVQQRSWTGTFCSVELEKAMDLGYTVLQTHEVWHWANIAEYNPSVGDEGLFTGYIRAFLKIKQESSGWPEGCDSLEEREQYLRDYQTHEGISLDPTKIKKNSLRAVAKLLLNSLWGKFAQNPDVCKTVFVTKYNVLLEYLSNASYEIRSLDIVHDRLIMLHYKDAEINPLQCENVPIAAFTTSHARLRLYGVMEQLFREGGEDKLCYTDTDSVFYVKRPGESDPLCGPFLGDLTDEYPRKKIVSFCSSGPKCYTCTFSDGSSVTKVKGITLNFRNSNIITPSVIEAMVRKPCHPPVQVCDPVKITRTKQHTIVSKPQSKRYRMVYSKRVIGRGGITFPFGYKGARKPIKRPHE